MDIGHGVLRISSLLHTQESLGHTEAAPSQEIKCFDKENFTPDVAVHEPPANEPLSCKSVVVPGRPWPHSFSGLPVVDLPLIGITTTLSAEKAVTEVKLRNRIHTAVNNDFIVDLL